AAVGSADYSENMTRRFLRVSIKSTDCRIADWQVAIRYRRVERDTENGAIRQNRVIASHIHPVRLCLSATAQVKADPDVTVDPANHVNSLILRRVLDVVDVPVRIPRIPRVQLRHVLVSGIIRYVPVRGDEGVHSALDCFPHPGSACNQTAATAGNTCRVTI